MVQDDFCLADLFLGILLKWSSPFLNLLLQVLVLFCGVGEMNGSTVVRQHLALVVVGHVNVSEVLSPSVGRDDEDFLAVLVLLNGRVRALCILHVAEQRM